MNLPSAMTPEDNVPVNEKDIFVIEVNPRASRTVPFLSKALGISLAKVATKAILGVPLISQGVFNATQIDGYFMKVPVFSDGLLDSTTRLGPEMLSTGEKMFVGKTLNDLIQKSRGTLVNPIALQEIYWTQK